MRDFPFFTTEYGVASLQLKEIPYRGQAYIRIRDVAEENLRPLLAECVSFCRMAGAEHIYAAGHEGLESWPYHVSVLEMRGEARVDPEKMASLFPVTEKTVTAWREIYNRAMKDVSNAATLECRDEPEIVDALGTYFIHEDGNLLGIGWMEDTKLLAIAAERGRGETVLNTLLSLVEGATVTLEVASDNQRAIRLYEKMGFVKTRELTRWYEVGKGLDLS